MARVVESVAGGAPLRAAVLGPEPIDVLDDLPPTDWSYLARYRPFARKIAGQTQIYLSRGCPFDCAFCMERAKREVSWRALSVERAVEELRRLHDFLGLEAWTVYIADALFGMRSAWRKALLEALARAAIPTRKIWLLIRVDMVDKEDLRLFGRANCGLGFGLESGDPDLLALIRKSGRLTEYLDRMRQVASDARELDVPWGANVIVGHPGETEASMRKSAAYLRELFLSPRGTTGFLSVDPFRLYPGSPIDEQRAHYERTYGTRFHRPAWWHDGDPEFLSEWIDPSRDLPYRERARLQHELLGPILEELPRHFCYRGPARDYFMRAVEDQRDNLSRRYRLHYIDRYYAWTRYVGKRAQADAERRADPELRTIGREEREELAPAVARAAGIAAGEWISEEHAQLRAALSEVPRELFVPVDQILESMRDVAVALDGSGKATLSAMHAYVRALTLLGVRQGDRLLDLGCGTGYGAALAAVLVTPAGRVHGVDVDQALVDQARINLEDFAARRRAAAEAGSEASLNVTFAVGDALDPGQWGMERPDRVIVGFALDSAPEAWLAALPLGAVVVAPLALDGGQRLARLRRDAGGFTTELFEEVLYVTARRLEPPPEPPPPRGTGPERRRSGPDIGVTEDTSAAARGRRALPLLT
jgi:protein-L-isoaspartate(D-aspartate) O-methyltransferase